MWFTGTLSPDLQTSGRGTGTPSQRDHDLSKENLRLASENLELRFQLEQANMDLPRLKVRVAKINVSLNFTLTDAKLVEMLINNFVPYLQDKSTYPR